MSERARMLRWPLVSLLVLAACPSKQPVELNTPRGGGVGCPSADAVYLATHVEPPEGEKGYSGWVMPLHHVKVESVKDRPAFAVIDEAAATAAGVPVKPSTIWLVSPNAWPCRTVVGDYYEAAIDGASPNVTYGVQLTGCTAPTESVVLALASAEEPSECKVGVPYAIASRIGELDRAGAWTPPVKETAIPAAFAALVPAKECTAPACEKLWSVAAVDLGGKPVAYGGAVNWVTKTTGGACPYETEAWSGFFIPGADGALVPITDGQDHPLALTLGLSDISGPTILVAQGPGEYTTYAVSGGAATIGRHLVWMIDEPDAYEALDHLGPDCPPPGAPAP